MTAPWPQSRDALMVSDGRTQWAARCRSADARSITFIVVSLSPPDWPSGREVRIQWADAVGAWLTPAVLISIEPGYQALWRGKPKRVNTRQAPRLPLALRLDYGLARADWTSHTNDVSLVGASFRAHLRVKVGEELHLVLRFVPRPLTIRAKVVRVTDVGGGWHVAVTWTTTDPGTIDQLRIALDAAHRAHLGKEVR